MLRRILQFVSILLTMAGVLRAAEDWPQFKFDSEHTGNAVTYELPSSLGLVGSIPLTDAVFASPAIVNDQIFVLDGSGVLFCVDANTLDVVWRFESSADPRNCNNVCSPAVIQGKVHFGTTLGDYFVLDASDGSVIRQHHFDDPIFSCPVLGENVVYLATLGSRVFSLSVDGDIRWQWDFVREVLQFHGDRWSGQDWLEHKRGRVTWEDQFLCSRNLAAHQGTLVVPAGGSIVWLKDEQNQARMLARFAPRESPATLGLSLNASGDVYRQWFRRDNGGRIEILKLVGEEIQNDFVRGTETSYRGDDSMSFSSVSLRGDEVYRCRPEQLVGIARHHLGRTMRLGDCPSIAAPILTKRHVIVSGLDGQLSVIPLDGGRPSYEFQTPFGRPITSSVAVANGKLVFGGEDGYLYVLGEDGDSQLPSEPLDLTTIRSPLTSPLAGAEFNWDRHFANQANTNRTTQGLQPPLQMRWIRRCEGTIKHLSTFGGGRMYTHTAEGQIMAVEQETGRLLWRSFYPGVHVSFTTPTYHRGRLYLPQAGLEVCRLRCLDAATGDLVWEAPFTGSPSWNRQLTPIIYGDLLIYPFSTGKYTGRNWLFEHQSTFGFSADQKPLVRAWNLETGREVWTRDFSEYGQGGDDAGLCVEDDTLYYSCYFGNKDPKGVTAALDPLTGATKWVTTKHAVHAGCTPSIYQGRLYLGGYNAIEDKINRVWCLDASTGDLIWKSDPVLGAIHTITVNGNRLFTHAQYRNGYLLNADTGQTLCELTQRYRCTRFTMDGDYLLGPNMDLIDTADENRLVSSGPAVDVLQCVGAQMSNGRMFYTANGSGLQLSMSHAGEKARSITE